MATADITKNPAVTRLAEKFFWWKSIGEALSDPVRFAAQVMTLGNWEDVQLLRSVLGDSLLRRTLREAPAGVFDQASWIYWHCVFGIEPVPELPRRQLC